MVWDRATGRPIYNAIVWQDRRTAELCAELDGATATQRLVRERTGLMLDPYFSATKIAWMLDNVPGARARAERGELAFGTVDTLSAVAADRRRRARDRRHQRLAHLAVRHPHGRLGRRAAASCSTCRARCCPRCATPPAAFGDTAAEHLGAAIAIRGIAGDQQAALIGQACFGPGMVKATYGTGCFILLNTGATPVRSQHAC